MAAYIYASIDLTDPVAYEQYRQRVPALIAAHGGRYLVRGGAARVLEGEAQAQRHVIIEFPDMTALEAFYNSPDYQTLVLVRQQASNGHLIALQGV
jgi:uncharacterized protein (DUF1330 family)